MSIQDFLFVASEEHESECSAHKVIIEFSATCIISLKKASSDISLGGSRCCSRTYRGSLTMQTERRIVSKALLPGRQVYNLRRKSDVSVRRDEIYQRGEEDHDAIRRLDASLVVRNFSLSLSEKLKTQSVPHALRRLFICRLISNLTSRATLNNIFHTK